MATCAPPLSHKASIIADYDLDMYHDEAPATPDTVESLRNQIFAEELDIDCHGIDDERVSDCTRKLELFGAAAIPVLIPALNHWSYSVRCTACSILGRLGPIAQEAIPALIANLDDPQVWPSAKNLVKEAAARCLAKVLATGFLGDDLDM